VVAYLIFVSSTMAAVTDEISRKAWVCICTPLLVGMVCLNDYSFLSWMSIGGLLALLAAFASVFAYGTANASPTMRIRDWPATQTYSFAACVQEQASTHTT
jgi:amino acid permease